MRTTRIFEVEYNYRECFNGKRDGDPIKESVTTVAKDAGMAVELVRLSIARESDSFIDDETKKKIVATKVDFDPINVTLLAES